MSKKTLLRLSDFNALANGQGIEGAINSALSVIEPGGTLLFDSVGLEAQPFEYAIYAPIYINKSVSLVGDATRGIKIINRTQLGPTFIVNPDVNNFHFDFINFEIISGSVGLWISGSKTLSPNSQISKAIFRNQISAAVRIESPELNIHIDNIWISGSPQYGIYLRSETSRDNFSVANSRIEGTTIAGVQFSKPALGTGPVFISTTEFLNNNQATVMDNVRYFDINIEYNDNQANYVLSGTAIRLSGSGGAIGGGGVTDHGALTGLLDDDHPQYIRSNGTRPMSGVLDMGGFGISNVGNVDGVDVSGLNSTVDAHILDSNNPHATSLANLDPGTLAELNTLISDGNVVSEASFNSFSSSISSSVNSLYGASSSFDSRLTTQNSTIARLDAASGTFRGELNSLTNSVIRLDSASGTFRIELTSITSSVNRLNAASATFESRLISQTASIARLDAASGTFRAELNSQTASVARLDAASGSFAAGLISFVNFSSSHASRHLSGGADPIDAQSLRANGIAINRVLISNGVGGWTTVLSSALGTGGGGAPDPHAASHLSGGSDPIDAQWLRADGVGANNILLTHTSGGFVPTLTSSLGFVIQSDLFPFSSSITASVARLNAASGTFRGELNLLNSASSSFEGRLISQTASIARLDAASGTFRSELSLLNSASSSFETRLIRLDNASGTFENELNALTASVVRLDSASGTFRTQIVVLTATTDRLNAASGTFRTELNLLNSASSSFELRDISQTASIARLDAASGTFRGELTSLTATTNRLNAASATFEARDISQTASIVRLDAASGTFRGELNLLNSASSSFETRLISQTASIVRLDAASGTYRTELNTLFGASSSFAVHAARHLSGGADPIDAQSLRANGIAVNRVLISDGLGGWTTVLSSAFGGGGGGGPPDAHASSHLSGGSDPIDAQWLRANGVAENSILLTHTSGGFVTALTSSLGLVIRSDLFPFSSSITASVALLIPASATFRSELNLLNSASSSFETRLVRLDNASGTFENELNALTTSVVRLDNASGTYRTELTALTATAIRLNAASGTFEARDISQTASIVRLDAASGTFRGELNLLNSASSSFATVSASFSPLSNSFSVISATLIHSSNSFAATSRSFAPVSASYNTLSASYYQSSASFATVSASFSPVSASYNALSAAFIGFSSSHASRHLSGGVDPIDAQSLRGNALGANLLLISNGVGGWTTVISTSVGTPAGLPGNHASTHLSGGADQISAQLLAANGLGPNLLMITDNAGGWTTVASQSVGGSGGGGITSAQSASTEGRSLISGVVGNTLYIKTLKSLTSSVDGLLLSDTSPILLSSSDDTVYIKRRPSSRAQYLFDDFIGGVVTNAGFAWSFTAGGGGGASIQVENVDLSTTNRANYMGPAIGMISMDTGTTAAGGVTLNGAVNSFSLRHMSASSIEWRAMFSGGLAAGTQEARVQLGWLDTVASGTRRPVNGIYFEMTSSNFGVWNIVATSASVHTVYNTGIPVSSASLRNYKIETVGFPPTSSFYINDSLVGRISSTMPYDRKPFGPMAKISKEIGTGQRELFIDWCEIFYESIRE